MKYLYKYAEDKTTELLEKLYLSKIEVEKETEKGYWIFHEEKKRFVLKGGNGKRYAYETTELALLGFLRKKERQIIINKNYISIAKKGIEIANKMLELC